MSKLKALLRKGDTDNGNTKKNAYEKMHKRKLCSAAKYPKNIHYGMAVKIRTHRGSEGPKRVTSYLKVLQTEGYADDSKAKNESAYKMDKSHPKSVKYKPNKVTYKSHYIPPEEILSIYTNKLYHKKNHLSIPSALNIYKKA